MALWTNLLVNLSSWWKAASLWSTSSLKNFPMTSFEIDSFWKNCPWKSRLLMADGYQWTAQIITWISEQILSSIGSHEVQLKSNWTIRKCRLILFKVQRIFFGYMIWKIIHFKKVVLEITLCWLPVFRELIRLSDSLANRSTEQLVNGC